MKDARPKNLSTEPRAEIGVPGFSNQEERTPRGRIFTSAEEADAHDPFVLVTKVPREKLPHLYVDCGTEDTFLKHSRDFLAVLMQHKIPFTYAESPGEHRSAYWRREIGHSMAVQAEILRRARAQAQVGKAQ
ncbi:MAG: hypothetical protein U0835_20170 [Isosphaeraceae bacterium]